MDNQIKQHKHSFSHLLALVEAGTTGQAFAPATMNNAVTAAPSSSIPISISQECRGRSMTSCKDRLTIDQDPLMVSKSHENESCTSNMSHYGHFVCTQPVVDLNLPILTEEVSLSRSCLHFAQINPDPAKNVEKRQSFDFQDSIMNEKQDHSRACQSELSAEMVQVNEIYQDKEHLELLKDQAGTALSNQFLENSNPDKGNGQGKDKNKTPQQKTRRSRHRPKVITEGQPKRTPNPKTPKPAASKHPRSRKRKHVQRNGLDKPVNNCISEVTTEAIDPRSARKTIKTCRRSLNFDFENAVNQEGSSSRPSPNFGSNVHMPDFCERDQYGSRTKHGKGMEASTAKAQVDLAYDVRFSDNQVLKCHIAMAEGVQKKPSTTWREWIEATKVKEQVGLANDAIFFNNQLVKDSISMPERVQTRSSTNKREGVDARTSKAQVDLLHNISENQVLEGYISVPEWRNPVPTTLSKAIPTDNNLMVESLYNS